APEFVSYVWAETVPLPDVRARPPLFEPAWCAGERDILDPIDRAKPRSGDFPSRSAPEPIPPALPGARPPRTRWTAFGSPARLTARIRSLLLTPSPPVAAAQRRTVWPTPSAPRPRPGSAARAL